MEKNLKKIERIYDSVAREYAETFSADHDKKPKDREMLNRFAKEVGGGGPVWDLGCGPGQTTRFLKDHGIEIAGLDLSEKLLEQAKTIHPDIHFKRGNVLGLEFEDDSIAGVVAFYTIIHFTTEHVEKFFREVFHVLQPGGIFLLTYHIGEETIHLEEFLGKTIDINFMFFAADFIAGCLERAGFEEIETIEREPYPGIEYQSRRAYVFAKKPAAQE